MNKNTVIGIVIAIIVIGGGILYFQNAKNQYGGGGNDTETPTINNPVSNTTTSEPVTIPSGNDQTKSTGESASQTKTITVTYTDQGFSPPGVGINLGDTVKFVNQSGGGMWVASNPHPIHTDYPEFDEKTFVQNGSSYQFTFTRVGSWSYHNHGRASMGGAVIVK